MTALTSDPGKIPNRFDIHENDPSSDYLIADSANELALMEVRRIKGKIVLLAVPDPLTIFEVNNLCRLIIKYNPLLHLLHPFDARLRPLP